jgi:tRNA pseudouridine55 synthase
VDKPEGPTSHDIIDIVRKAIGVRRVGHTGTLDPFASGLLLLCVGWATRLAEYLTVLPKAYRGVIRLGERTDTDDQTGVVIEASDTWRSLGVGDVQEALRSQVGELEQVPPSHSAKKLEGRRAYAVARAGETPALQPQRVTIHRLGLAELELPDITVDVECSSGTYIRAIARDVGAELGVGAHLRALRRMRIGDFDVARAMAVTRETPEDEIVARLQPPESAITHMPRAAVGESEADALRHGRPVAFDPVGADAMIAVTLDDALIAVGQYREGRLWPHKVFQATGGGGSG